MFVSIITSEALASDCIVLIQKQDWHLSAATNTCTIGSQPTSHTQHRVNEGSTSWMSTLLILNAYPTVWMHTLQLEWVPCSSWMPTLLILNAYPPMTPSTRLKLQTFLYHAHGQLVSLVESQHFTQKIIVGLPLPELDPLLVLWYSGITSTK